MPVVPLLVDHAGPANAISSATIAAFKKGLRGDFGVASGESVDTCAELDEVTQGPIGLYAG